MSLIPGRSTLFDPFSLDIWDQFEGFSSNSQFRSLSDQIRSGFPAEASSMLQTRVDWKETPNSHIFKADVPGLKKEELKVEVEDGRVLRISGERRREIEEKTDHWHRVERSQGSFMRKFRLPEDARVDEVKAAMQDGVLTVTVPKEGAKNPNVKSVQIAD